MSGTASGTGPGERRLNGIQTSGREFRNLSEPAFGIDQADDVAVAMRDGVELLADVYRPDAAGRFPALLAFSAYPRQIQNLRAPLGLVEAGASDFFVPRGYAHVIANARGTCGSGGTWSLLCRESVVPRAPRFRSDRCLEDVRTNPPSMGGMILIVDIEPGSGPFDRAEETLLSTADADLPTIGVLRLATDRLGWVLQHAGFDATDEAPPPASYVRAKALRYMGTLAVQAARPAIAVMRVGYEAEALSYKRMLLELHAGPSESLTTAPASTPGSGWRTGRGSRLGPFARCPTGSGT